jgi:hypothetical protein
MLNPRMGRRLLLFGLLVMSGMSTREALAQAVVLLKCTYFNGGVERIKIDPTAKKADFLNSGGTFALEISESFYTLTTEFDFGASGGGVVDLETKINRRSQQLTSRIVGLNRNFTQYPLSGTCSRDQP